LDTDPAFDHGIHRRVGAPLARLEFDVIVSGVLQRMPDYCIDHESTHNYPDVGLMYGYQRMPIRFTPGQAPLQWPGDDQRVSRSGPDPGPARRPHGGVV
jgi:hypothetical protein